MMTPRAHGIHHSIVARETNSNFSNFLILWDRLHRTLRLDVRQDEIVIGVPCYRDARELGVNFPAAHAISAPADIARCPRAPAGTSRRPGPR